jgi:hypothetical protein
MMAHSGEINEMTASSGVNGTFRFDSIFYRTLQR